KLGATSPMLEEGRRQKREGQKGKIAMIKNDIVHFQNTLKIGRGRKKGKRGKRRKRKERKEKRKGKRKRQAQGVEKRKERGRKEEGRKERRGERMK
ncbi:hypothetical protein FM860_09615, partial [Francisella tularensis]|nr:hypothetical protein [Francisella tularensis]